MRWDICRGWLNLTWISILSCRDSEHGIEDERAGREAVYGIFDSGLDRHIIHVYQACDAASRFWDLVPSFRIPDLTPASRHVCAEFRPPQGL